LHISSDWLNVKLFAKRRNCCEAIIMNKASQKTAIVNKQDLKIVRETAITLKVNVTLYNVIMLEHWMKFHNSTILSVMRQKFHTICSHALHTICNHACTELTYSNRIKFWYTIDYNNHYYIIAYYVTIIWNVQRNKHNIALYG